MNQDIERECIEEVKHRHVDGSNGNEFTDNSVNGELLVKDEKEAVVTQESEDEEVEITSDKRNTLYKQKLSHTICVCGSRFVMVRVSCINGW